MTVEALSSTAMREGLFVGLEKMLRNENVIWHCVGYCQRFDG